MFEPCDSPTLLGVERCLDINAGNGNLSCTAQCTFDYSDCSAPPDGWESPNTPVDEEEGGCAFGYARRTGATYAFVVCGVALVLGLRLRRGGVRGPRR
jgi:hypothetical protein